MKIKSILFCLLAVVMASCGSDAQKSENRDSGANTVEDKAVTELPSTFYMQLKGTINGNLPITMEMTKTDSVVHGTYYYDKIKIPITVYGNSSGISKISLHEVDENFEETGKFEGEFVSADTFKGTWTNATTNKAMPFVLVQNKEGVAGISFEHFRKENCDLRNENLKHVEDIVSWTDTLCSYIEVTTIKVSAANAEASAAINKTISDVICFNGERHYPSIQAYVNSVDTESDEYYYTQEYSVRVLMNENNILSISIDYSEFSGGAHPLSGCTYYSFDLTTGKQIQLSDILKPGSAMRLNQIGEPLFVKQYGEDGWNFEPGHFEFNSNYAIMPGGLIFLFGQYEIGSYAAGMPEVFLPFKSIEELIKPGSVIDRK